jgi:hypothetical protein
VILGLPLAPRKTRSFVLTASCQQYKSLFHRQTVSHKNVKPMLAVVVKPDPSFITVQLVGHLTLHRTDFRSDAILQANGGAFEAWFDLMLCLLC